MDKKQEKKLGSILKKFNSGDETVISVLQDMQEAFGFVPEEAVYWFSEKTNVPASKFFGIATFYSQFHLSPRGKNIITACCGTVCHVKGSERIITRLRDDLSLKGEQETTKDGKYTLETVNCVGACSIAPILIVNDKVHGNMNPDKAVKSIKVTGKEK
jgi:NADH:ubiquinone oxidoreductase subunit E